MRRYVPKIVGLTRPQRAPVNTTTQKSLAKTPAKWRARTNKMIRNARTWARACATPGRYTFGPVFMISEIDEGRANAEHDQQRPRRHEQQAKKRADRPAERKRAKIDEGGLEHEAVEVQQPG